jgi:cytidine deaminase
MQVSESIIAQLKHHAVEAAGNSHSPYSHFPVGAAVISGNGTVYSGCNVENASFSLTQCAERAALTAAICDGNPPGSMTALLIYTPGHVAHTPCGACRQVMHELMEAGSSVISCCDGEQIRTWNHDEYLPDPFVPDALLK